MLLQQIQVMLDIFSEHNFFRNEYLIENYI